MSNPNLWSLPKSNRIKQLLILLNQQLGGEAFSIDLATETADESIYICDCQDVSLRAYLFTIGQAHNRYGVHLEHPQESAENFFDSHENLTLKNLVDILAVHFNVANINPLPA